MNNLVSQFKTAKRVSTPLIVIRTQDQTATVNKIAASFNGDGPSIFAWDSVRGVSGRNVPGIAYVRGIKEAQAQAAAADRGETLTPEQLAAETDGPLLMGIMTALCVFPGEMPEKSILFLHNFQRHVDPAQHESITVSQAFANLRDFAKQAPVTIVALVPDITLPGEFANDVLVLRDDLPTEEELINIAAALGVTEDKEKIVDATLGLGAFQAEQNMAMALSKEGVNFNVLHDLRRESINEIKGLSMETSGPKLEDIGGSENIIDFHRQLLTGRQKYRVLVHVDEIEKSPVGSQGSKSDSSGVSQDMLGFILTEMADRNYTGSMATGVPGTGKSVISQALAAACGCLYIRMDMGAFQEGLVGATGANVRRAFEVIWALSGGAAHFIATSNNMSSIDPALLRRFGWATFFVDVPNEDAAKGIWLTYCIKYEQEWFSRPNDCSGWTGAEIEKCCRIAWQFNCSLQDAAKYVVPITVSAASQIHEMRMAAHNTMMRADRPGIYQYEQAKTDRRSRTLDLR